MGVQFIGMITTRFGSEIHPPEGPAIDRDYVRQFAQAHEAAGFDRILVPQGSSSPDAFLTVSYAAAATEKITFLLAHRPGFIEPTLAARKLATLDQFSGGRLAVHIISGGSDIEQQRDGDFLSHDERYARTDEYLAVVRAILITEKPIDHQGRFYHFNGGYSEVKSVQKPHVPIFFGGASDIAIEVAAKHADIYALWGEPLAPAADLISRVTQAAAKLNRKPGFSVSFRPIIADTEEAAWRKADEILERALELRRSKGLAVERHNPANVGSQRLLQAAAGGDRHDKRLWTGLAAATGAQGNSTSLVGTPEQVAEAFLDYYDLGVENFLIRGFDPLDDATDYGRSLIPLTRELVTKRRPNLRQAS